MGCPYKSEKSLTLAGGFLLQLEAPLYSRSYEIIIVLLCCAAKFYKFLQKFILKYGPKISLNN